jgi:hypothetical protein
LRYQAPAKSDELTEEDRQDIRRMLRAYRAARWFWGIIIGGGSVAVAAIEIYDRIKGPHS